MSAAAKCLQVMLALFNLAFLVFGIVVLAFAVTYLTQSPTDSSAYTSGIVLSCVGGASIVIGVFGCVGAFCRSRCALIVYSIFVVILIVACCVVGGLMLASAGDSAKVQDFGINVWSAMNDQARNQFQKQYNCCGYTAPWDNPGSVCPPITSLPLPCQSSMNDILYRAVQSAGIILLVAAGCEIISVAIAMILIFDSKSRKSGYGRGY